MSPEASEPAPTTPERAEPKAGPRAVPVFLLILLLGIVYGGMIYFDRASGWFDPQVYAPYHSASELALYQPPTGGLDLSRGRTVYDNICALCHNTDGTGKPNQAPPFVGSDWVLGSPNRMIRIPLVGLAGSVMVKDQQWNLAMPAMGAALSDDDLAAVLSYIRQSWGNKASVITPEQVKAVRAEIGNRTQPWSAQELEAIH